MLEQDRPVPQQVGYFLQPFRDAFHRREQAEWAAVYLQGLLQPGGRKSIENLARTLTLPDSQRVEDVAQALQHFINQSPWDEQKIYRRYHRLLAERRASVGGVFVFDEFAFIKQGRHSVGVQRQYSTVLGRKANCQIAVALHHLSPAGLWPLALRLYLPRHWLDDGERLDAAGVPPIAHKVASKNSLALELLDDAREAGIAATHVTVGNAWGRSEELGELVRQRGLDWLADIPASLTEIVCAARDELQNELGLGHFEGRSWRGFHHHACLVVLAYALKGSVQNKAERAEHRIEETDGSASAFCVGEMTSRD